MKQLILALAVLASTQVIAQQNRKPGEVRPEKPGQPQPLPKGMTSIKPFFVIGDARTLNFQGEVFYYSNDSLVSSTKAKWNGSSEVVAADGKTFSISLVEEVVDNKITLSDLIADIEATRENTDFLIRMDKSGKLIGVDNFDDVKATYITDKQLDQKAEKRKLSKEEKTAIADSVSQALLKNDMLRTTIYAYAKNYFDLYGKVIPATTNLDTIRNGAEVNTKRYFGAATKNVDAEQKMYLSDVKGGKFTLNEVLEYNYPAMQDFLVNIKVKDPVFEANTSVKDHIQTIYDPKMGWPVKITEELIITNGKYKVVYKWMVKFVKDK